MGDQSSESQVSIDILTEWRKQGILQKDEIAYQIADLFVAENVITRERRVINLEARMRSESARILKG
jgi:hypothetical protein|tara:strand:+ start:16477 stop:16677 length:201 start_codon:yes stop_codon:yes gene_type:complete